MSSTILRTSPEPDANSSAAELAAGEPTIIRRERSVLNAIVGLVGERAESEAKVESTFTRSDATADEKYQQTRQTLVEKFARLERETHAEDENRRRAVTAASILGETQAKNEFASASRKIAAEFDSIRETAKYEHNKAKAQAGADHDSSLKRAAKENAEALRPIDENSRISDEIRTRLATLAAAYQKKFGLKSEPPAPARETYAKFEKPDDEVFTRLAKLEQPLKLVEGLIIPKMLIGAKEIWVILFGVLLLVVPAAFFSLDATTLGIAAAIGLGVGVGLRFWLLNLARSQLACVYDPLMRSLSDAEGLSQHSKGRAEAQLKQAREKAAARQNQDLQKAKDRHAFVIKAGEDNRDERLRKINEAYAQKMTDVQTNQARAMREAIEAHELRVTDLKNRSEANFKKLDENYQTLKQQIRTRRDSSWQDMANRWRDGMIQAQAEVAEVNREVDGYGPPWVDPSWDSRPFPVRVPPVLRSGAIQVEVAALPGGLPADARLREGIRDSFSIPALRPFPSHANLLIEAPPEGRAAAIGVLQASMFRLLTSLPPGQVRFTIVDPIGIGRNFGAFMHLADFDPALVSNQVWTDPRQIEERLAELAIHMETVTQKYLRNEYATIEEYNAVAEEVAEPYRVLVVADFPSAFDEKAAGRLAAIAAGGVPCGVLTLIAVDPTRPMPPGFRIEDIRPFCDHLNWDGVRLIWDNPDFGKFPLALDPPPPSEFATRQIQKVGAAAKDAKRVEVPFEFIAPPEEAWWTKDSRAGVDVPLGKAGATKRQNLRLGEGTSQHVLIAGRTGSGKSTMMHALITNLALNYSPDEIDLYLIDFKKGVEFKVYATHELPHASVVAIESEREFGISVLQRLDTELRLRADKFRDAGVQDVNGYRNVPGSPPLPRILLIVDEFQEFFVEEDKLAQEAALLLDRLVRQGRAFGVHVHLGSQSLGGAFTLARSTLGQMAVRIALQCSEADSHLILAEQNPAARLLSRPGEAIYNDANGATEGNHFFQVVWLSDERREAYLEKLSALARERKPILARTPIVFEGDAPAELSRNAFLKERLEKPAWPENPRSALAWLGDPVAIKDPTSALFRRQGGNHLLIVGQNDEAAIGVASAALISLASQFPPSLDDNVRTGAKFFVLDGTPEDHANTGMLSRVASALPHGVKVGGWRDASTVLAEIGAELKRRQTEGDGPELFLFVHDLPRFRDLRRKEDDFSFSRSEENASPSDHLEAILREGPGLGVHLITWCDTVNNLNRYFTHQLLREFEMRVLFQMSPNDSGHILDSPAASKLGPNRALFASEEQNRLEKFRPYGAASEEWLGKVAELLKRVPGPGGV